MTYDSRGRGGEDLVRGHNDKIGKIGEDVNNGYQGQRDPDGSRNVPEYSKH